MLHCLLELLSVKFKLRQNYGNSLIGMIIKLSTRLKHQFLIKFTLHLLAAINNCAARWTNNQKIITPLQIQPRISNNFCPACWTCLLPGKNKPLHMPAGWTQVGYSQNGGIDLTTYVQPAGHPKCPLNNSAAKKV